MTSEQTPTIEGGCNCGAVRYRIEGPALAVAACHCTRCRGQSGSAFSVNIVAKARTVTIDGPLCVYEDPDTASGQPVVREFCPSCGSPIRSTPAARPAIVAIKAGTADRAADFAPTLHMWTQSKLPWVTIPADLPQFPRDPT